MSDEVPPNSYDQAPYPSLSYGQSHPDRLATLATLMGLSPPPITRCRVLELGCAAGGNLMPMAYGLPESEFVGIDYSGRQIEEGQAAVAALGLANISLRHLNILDADESLGAFDYIIAHGVYSWVPVAVRDKVLAICRGHLRPNGVAYVSYNIYPGWHMMGMVRQMMLYHIREVDEPHERAVKARALLDFLVEGAPAGNSAYGAFLEAYRSGLVSKVANAEELLLHDELEEVNDPVYFHEFVEHAGRHGLQYLVEAEFPTVVPDNFPPAVVEKLRMMVRSLVELEQYMDFLRSRTFRQTLLCHREVEISRALRPERLGAFQVASMAQAVAATPDVGGVTAEQFRDEKGAVFTTNHPATKAALLSLIAESPHALPFMDLMQVAFMRLAKEAPETTIGNPPQEAYLVAANLLQAFSYSMNLVELHSHVAPYVRRLSERPVASPVAHYQGQRGRIVTNLRHERSELDEFTRYVLLQLDGSRDRETVLAELVRLAAEGVVKPRREGESLAEPAEARERLAAELDRCLAWLVRAALLVA
jgi:methyltransferase-like protein/2-polyprenyl-3-methyl-5-hydroxy-6-metoxy-1,4-benzoquinol methylase